MRRLSGSELEKLEALALSVLEACKRELPISVHEVAETTPTFFRPLASDAESDEVSEDLLGEYVEFCDEAAADGSGVIVLYLEAILAYCRSAGLSLEDEIKRTYLHELGHRLGWDEEDLAARDLD